VEIDIELAPGDQSSTPKTKEQSEKDAGNQLHMLTNRHDKFLDSLREVKVNIMKFNSRIVYSPLPILSLLCSVLLLNVQFDLQFSIAFPFMHTFK